MGFLQAFAPRIAGTVDAKWKDLGNGYFTAKDIYGDIEG